MTAAKRPRFFALPEMRYQNTYVWLVLVSALDVILTMLVLTVWGGSEVNPIVASIIHETGFFWAIVFKFAVMIGVIIICEVVGRVSDRKGRRLARFAVILSALPSWTPCSRA